VEGPIPPALTLRTVLDAVPHPRWWFDLLTTETPSFASLDRWPGTVAEYLDTMFDPTVTFEDLAWIKTQWPNKLVVKGIQTLDDAKAVVDLGVDGIVLSNHGGRQLDRAPVPFHLLPVVARELGKAKEIAAPCDAAAPLRTRSDGRQRLITPVTQTPQVTPQKRRTRVRAESESLANRDIGTGC
jgi:hypothetical protein